MAKRTESAPVEPVTNYQLVGYTLRCWPQNHFYSTNLVEILNEYDLPTHEAKRALGLLRAQGYAEYIAKPPGRWRIRKAARQFPLAAGHGEIYAALVDATMANIDARLAGAQTSEAAPTLKGLHYRWTVAAALQIWPANHFEALELRAYCDRFAGACSYASQRARAVIHHKVVDEGRAWFSEVHPRLGRITPRGRMAPLCKRGPEVLAAMRAHPPEASGAWQDYVNAYALDHPGEWTVPRLLDWLGGKLEAVPPRPKIILYLQYLEGRHRLELMQKGTRSQATRYRTRPALYEAAAPDLALYEQLLHPDGHKLAERCYPKGRPQDLNQVGRVAPELADGSAVAAMALPAEQGLEKERAPSTVRAVTLKGLPEEEELPEAVAHMVTGSGSSIAKAAGLIDYINELRAGAGVEEVTRLRRKVDNLTGALQAVKNKTASQKRAINQLNAIKAQQEEQIKDLCSQLAAANNRLEQATTAKRPRVRTRLDKGAGFGLGEVATFKGRPLNLDRPAPVVEKKRARG